MGFGPSLNADNGACPIDQAQFFNRCNMRPASRPVVLSPLKQGDILTSIIAPR